MLELQKGSVGGPLEPPRDRLHNFDPKQEQIARRLRRSHRPNWLLNVPYVQRDDEAIVYR